MGLTAENFCTYQLEADTSFSQLKESFLVFSQVAEDEDDISDTSSGLLKCTQSWINTVMYSKWKSVNMMLLAWKAAYIYAHN